jgi:hypothetical protein
MSQPYNPMNAAPPAPLRGPAARPADALPEPAIARRGHYARNAAFYVTFGLIATVVGWLLAVSVAEFAYLLVLAGSILLLQGIVGVVQNIQASSANLEYLAHTLVRPATRP